jgi:hypothetical protein
MTCSKQRCYFLCRPTILDFLLSSVISIHAFLSEFNFSTLANYVLPLKKKVQFYNYIVWPPLWSRGQSSPLQIQRSGFDSRRYQILREVVSLERGPLSLVSTIEELFERKSSGSCLESREYSRRDPLC